jgi:hypothetical protein
MQKATKPGRNREKNRSVVDAEEEFKSQQPYRFP